MTEAAPRRFGLAHLIAFLAGIVFFALSFVLLAILPGRRLEEAMLRDAPVGMAGYTAQEAEGRAIYAREGCDYCHTEQVRGTLADVARWGPATQPWETRYDYPQVWGTRRIGPDLAREAGVRSRDWQLTHLFSPRWVVPGSVMPGYPWLFDGDARRPNAQGRAVLAYLDTLGRAMLVAGPSAICPKPAHGTARLEKASATGGDADRASAPVHLEDGMVVGGSLDANAAKQRLTDTFPDLATGDPGRDPQARRTAGSAVFAQYCAGCHGAAGGGDGPAAASLLPRPANLQLASYSGAALSEVLWNGRPGTSMPAWRDLSKAELADVIAFVDGLRAPPAPADADVLARGATVYAENCLVCHGIDGRGAGPAAHLYLPRPANFTLLQPARARVMQVLAEGVPGAPMPVFAGLPPLDRIAVADYVRTLYASSGGSDMFEILVLAMLAILVAFVAAWAASPPSARGSKSPSTACSIASGASKRKTSRKRSRMTMAENQTVPCEVDAARSRAIVEFWRDVGMDGWFRVDPDFDRMLADRFMEDHLAAARRERDGWARRPDGALALLMLLDDGRG